MALFLIVYNQTTGELAGIRRFDDVDRKAALRARFDLERKHRLDRNIEVVLLGADDEETLQKTHARYFKSAGDLVAGA